MERPALPASRSSQPAARRLALAIGLIASLSIQAVSAATYFVDSESGSDSFSGTIGDVVGTPPVDGPWRTLSRVNQQVLQPGDRVLLRCGSSWRGTLTITESGTPEEPIRVTQYGADCNGLNKPIITSGETIGGWQQYSGNIYVTDTYFPVRMLFVDGVAQPLAHYPNKGVVDPDNPENVFLTIDSDPNTPYLQTDRLTDADLDLGPDQGVVGATAHVRLNDWRLQERVISDFDPVNKTMYLESRTSHAIRPGWGYYLDNKLWMLDSPGEWYLDESDPENRKLYLWMPDGSAPDNVRVIGARSNYGIDARETSDLIISHIALRHLGIGAQISRSQRVTLRHLDVTGSHFAGIVTNDSDDNAVDSCTIVDTTLEGIQAGESTDLTVFNNTIINAGLVGLPIGNTGAITVHGERATIKNNRVMGAAYHGIAFTKNSSVANNYVEGACALLNDCAGIYTGNNRKNTGYTPHNSEIVGNTVVGVHGNANGRIAGLSESLTPAIYVDYRSDNLWVSDNTTVESDSGILLHATTNVAVVRNTFYDTTTYAIRMYDRFFNEVADNRISRNRIFNKNAASAILRRVESEDAVDLNTYDANRYSALHATPGTSQSIVTWRVDSGTWSLTDYTLEGWQALGFDLDSTVFEPFELLPQVLTPLDPPVVAIDERFDSDEGTAGWIAFSPDGVANLSWSDSGCQDSGCLLLETDSQATRGFGILTRFPIAAGRTYRLEFDARTAQPGQDLMVIPRLAGPGSTVLDGFHNLITGGDWNSHTVVFDTSPDITVGEFGGRIDFRVGPDTYLQIDNVRIEEVVSASNDPDDESKILLNPGSSPTQITCADAGIDARDCDAFIYFSDESPVSWPVTLGPRKSEVIVRTNSPFRN